MLPVQGAGVPSLVGELDLTRCDIPQPKLHAARSMIPGDTTKTRHSQINKRAQSLSHVQLFVIPWTVA